MLSYEFVAPRKIVFGWGRRAEIGSLAAPLGKRALLVLGSRSLKQAGLVDELRKHLQAAGVELQTAAEIAREPLADDVDRAAAELRQLPPREGDFILAVGGGAALDFGKALAAMATNLHGQSVRDFLEGVGRGLSLDRPPLPILALPTTGGTGSEATKNAVISSVDPPFKKSLRAEGLLPAAALVDPQLACSLPPATTIATGLDAITQLIESYISCRARPIPQALALAGLKNAPQALEAAIAEPDCRWARETLAQAALFSGMALANSGLGLAHGVAAALGVQFHVPHGLACAVMLPTALRANREVAARRLAELAEPLLGRPAMTASTQQADVDEAADAVVDAAADLCRRLQVPQRLSELGVGAGDIEQLARNSQGNSLAGNPRPIEHEELCHLLESLR